MIQQFSRTSASLKLNKLETHLVQICLHSTRDIVEYRKAGVASLKCEYFEVSQANMGEGSANNESGLCKIRGVTGGGIMNARAKDNQKIGYDDDFYCNIGV